MLEGVVREKFNKVDLDAQKKKEAVLFLADYVSEHYQELYRIVHNFSMRRNALPTNLVIVRTFQKESS